MATKRKTAAEIREEEVVKAEVEMMDEVPDTSSVADATPSPQGEGLDSRDAEIARLKAELAAAKKAGVSEVFVPNGRGDLARLKQLSEDTVKAGKDEWKVTVKVRVPRKSGGDDDFWVNVNNISAQIPANGEIQELKLPWALDLMESLEAEDRALDFAENIQNYDPVNNPKPIG